MVDLDRHGEADAAFAALEHELKRLTNGLRRVRGHGNQHSRGLTMAQYGFVETLLDAAEPIAVGTLASRAGLSRPTATTMTRTLEEAGLVVRTGDPNDARVVRLALTAEGRQQARERRAEQQQWRDRITSAVGIADLAPGARVLGAIADQIDVYLDEQAGPGASPDPVDGCC